MVPETKIKLPTTLKIRNISKVKGSIRKFELIHLNKRQWNSIEEEIEPSDVNLKENPAVGFQVIPWADGGRVLLPVCIFENGEVCYPMRTRSGVWVCRCKKVNDHNDHERELPPKTCGPVVIDGILTCSGGCDRGSCKLVKLPLKNRIYLVCACVYRRDPLELDVHTPE
jgi:hypothetical protein